MIRRRRGSQSCTQTGHLAPRSCDHPQMMRVGVYVDGYNLYYGGRKVCGRGRAGWRWLNLRELAYSVATWQGASIERVVYCTARVNSAESPSASNDQSIYIRALQATNSIDVLELGRYVAWPKTDPLTDVDAKGRARVIQPDGTETWDPRLPITRATDCNGTPMLQATVRRREEKGSDVNVATHLLHDVLTGCIDAAIVISNDSDLSLPLKMSRQRVPLGTVNPGTNPLAGALKGLPAEGVGGHWWRPLSAADYNSHQLPNHIGGTIHRPAGW